MIIRPATAEDVNTAFYDLRTVSTKSYAAEKDGQILGVAGIGYLQSKVFAFAHLRKDLQHDTHKYQMTIMRVAKKVVALMEECGCDVYAVADEELHTSMNFLKHLGFVHIGERVHIWRKK